MTNAEIKLWTRLKSKQIDGYQFYRQKIIGKYIVDFCCLKTKLVIEIDGSQHYTEIGTGKDKNRDDFLHQLGFRTLRYNDNDVLTNTEGVLEDIIRHLSEA